MIARDLDKFIENHYDSNKSALLLTGARQTGKTFAMRRYAKKKGLDLLEINFLEDPTASLVFKNVSGEDDLILRLSAYARRPLSPEKTFIFFDEIQKCPEVVTMIKFLVDKTPYKYGLSGSLLGVELKNIRSVPVGYMDVKEVFPLDFLEFAKAVGVESKIITHINKAFETHTPVDTYVHKTIMKLLYLYLVVGGMPAAVQTYIDSKDISSVQMKQKEILSLYKWDISQYDIGSKLFINEIFDLIPSELNSKNKRFILKNLNEGSRFSTYENGFIWLKNAGSAIPVYNVKEAQFPLLLNKQRNLMKLFQNDVGLLTSQYAAGTALSILSGNVNINYGAIYENFVAQELLSHGFGQLYYFNSKKLGELDFLIEKGDGNVIPIEVKSGKNYEQHKAIDNVLKVKQYNIKDAYVFCNDNVTIKNNVIYLPVYMVSFLQRNRYSIGKYEIDLTGLAANNVR